MWTLHTADKEHWVPIKTIASFKRMRDFVPYGLEWLVDALRASEELELDESGEKVRRLTELQPPKGQFERSVYAVSRPLHFFSACRPSSTVSSRLGQALHFLCHLSAS